MIPGIVAGRAVTASGGESVPFAAVELLINAETAGATADDFIDASSNARTITSNSADTKRRLGGQKWGTHSVGAVSLSRTDFTVGSAADWKFLHDGTEKWTLDIWLDRADTNATARILFDTSGGTTTNSGLFCGIDSTGAKLRVQMYRAVSDSYVINGTFATALTGGTDYAFLRLVYDPTLGSEQLKLFENGAARGSLSETGNAHSSANPAYPLRFFGLGPSGSQPLRGFADDIRVVKGYALDGSYVPSAAFPTS